MAAVLPGSSNTYVPSHEATGKLVVDFARNPAKFPLLKYVQVVPVDKINGYYLEMTVEEAGRLLNTDLSDLVWPDGNDMPTGADGTESHEFKSYLAKRYAPSFRLGDLTVQQASWDILAQHARIKAQQMMTGRTQLAATALQTAGNYAASHTSAVASIPGNVGNWTSSTTARGDIKRSLYYAMEKILDDTLAAVEQEDIQLVLCSADAKALSETQEIVDHIKGSPDALAQIRGELPGQNAMYGLPNKLFGFNVIVDKTRKVTSKKGATKAVSSVLTAGKPFLCSRPGGLVGVADAPTFSTCTIFALKGAEMAVESLDDRNNKRKVGRIIDMFDVKMTAPASGFLFTSAT